MSGVKDHGAAEVLHPRDRPHVTDELAEAEGHHPDLHLSGYRNVVLELYTHAVGGLTENDFILAAKIDVLTDGAAGAR